MECKFCGNQMDKEDVDFNFKGNMDVYWICKKCNASAISKIRYGHFWKCEWEREELPIT